MNLPKKLGEQGQKFDSAKPDLSLIPSSMLIQVGHVLTYGANKYAAHNWRAGININRLIGAALRHIVAFNEGENTDSESKLPHLAHAICELAFALEQSLNPTRYARFDNRYIAPKKRVTRAAKTVELIPPKPAATAVSNTAVAKVLYGEDAITAAVAAGWEVSIKGWAVSGVTYFPAFDRLRRNGVSQAWFISKTDSDCCLHGISIAINRHCQACIDLHQSYMISQEE